MNLARLGEFGLIDLLSRGAPVDQDVLVGIGDDAAVVRTRPGQDLLLTCDLLHDGVHFRSSWYADRDPGLLGRKALAASISDIASQGGLPRFCLVTLGAGQDLTAEFLVAVFSGLYALAREHGISVVGGDTVGLAQGLLLDVFLTGEVETGRALLRTGAQPGDLILVTGGFGLARAGLELLEQPAARTAACGLEPAVRERAVAGQLMPPVRLAAARRLAATGLLHAMSDTSDGLAAQVHHICRQSGCGAIVRADAVPVDAAAAAVARACGVEPLEWALWGGEDYELIMTAPPAAQAALLEAVAGAAGDKRDGLCDPSLTVIGRITAPREIVLERGGGTTVPLDFAGYQHFRSPDVAGKERF